MIFLYEFALVHWCKSPFFFSAITNKLIETRDVNFHVYIVRKISTKMLGLGLSS